MKYIKHMLTAIAALLLLLLTSGSFCANLLPGMDASDSAQIMRVSQVKRGMKGYGLTVFQGSKIEKFDVEILGVVNKMIQGKDFILVKVAGGPLTSRNTSIISGMSGSPCYINGKMIGAIAYGTSFCKENVGMVTPIEYMLEAFDPNLPQKASGYSSEKALAEPIKIGGKIAKSVMISSADMPDSPSSSTMTFKPLAIPLAVAGVSSNGMLRLEKLLKPLGINPVAGGGSGSAVVKDKLSLSPGSAIGVSLAYGDIDMTGIGTVTYRKGNRLLAFGHPMMQLGAFEAPVSTAYITDIISGYESSFKLGAPVNFVAKLTQDRPFSIAAEVGKQAHTIPIVIKVYNQVDKKSKTFKVQIVDHPLFSSLIASIVVGEAISYMQPTPTDMQAELDFEVVADQVGTIKRSNVFFSSGSIEMAALADLDSVLGIISRNKFYQLDIKSINVNIKIERKHNTAVIENLSVSQNTCRPGGTIAVDVAMRPYKKDIIHKTLEVKVPETMPEGMVVLQIKGGDSSDSNMAMLQMAGMFDISDMGSSSSSTAENTTQLINKFLETEKNNQISAKFITRAGYLNVRGEKMPGIPAPFASVIRSSKTTAIKIEKADFKQVFDDTMIISGTAQIPIEIKSKNISESKAAESPSSQPPSSGPMPASDGASQLTAVSADEVSEESTFNELADKIDTIVPVPDKPEEISSTEEIKKDVSEEKSPQSSSDSAKTPVKSVVRQMSVWTQKTSADFAKGTSNGAGTASNNSIVIMPNPMRIAESENEIVWKVLPVSDGLVAGTGHFGRIVKVGKTGNSVLMETGELEVLSLVSDSAGNIYAGTAPNGKIFKISNDGKSGLFATIPAKYVSSLVLIKDSLYASAGDSNKVFKIDSTGKVSTFCELPSVQVVTLYSNSEDVIYAGCGLKGVVYKITADGKFSVICDNLDSVPSAIATDSKGQLFVTTAPMGSLYRIDNKGNMKQLLTKLNNAVSMVCIDDNIYVASNSGITIVKPDETVIKPVQNDSKDIIEVQYTSISKGSLDKTLLLGSSYPGAFYYAFQLPTIGTYISAVFDSKYASSIWGNINVTGNIPETVSAITQTRSGNCAIPDESWSGWSVPRGVKITSPSARYIQYKIDMDSKGTFISPEITAVRISYMPPNQAPKLAITSPLGGEFISNKKSITWTAQDPDKDTLTYDVFYSSDNGANWSALVGGMSGNAIVVDEAKIIDKINTEVSASSDIPEEVKKKIKTEVKEDEPKIEPVKASSNTNFDWDTTKVKDGSYILKITASDKTSNGKNALIDEELTSSFVVCNAKPEITIDKASIKVAEDGKVSILGKVKSTLTTIIGVSYRIDGGSWNAADADDGLFDSASENFSVSTDVITTGNHKIDIQAVDNAGNEKIEKVEVKR